MTAVIGKENKHGDFLFLNDLQCWLHISKSAKQILKHNMSVYLNNVRGKVRIRLHSPR